MSHGGLYLSQTSNNISAAASILSSTQGPTMSTANGSSHQQTQMGLTPQQKQEKLNLIRANSTHIHHTTFMQTRPKCFQTSNPEVPKRTPAIVGCLYGETHARRVTEAHIHTAAIRASGFEADDA